VLFAENSSYTANPLTAPLVSIATSHVAKAPCFRLHRSRRCSAEADGFLADPRVDRTPECALQAQGAVWNSRMSNGNTPPHQFPRKCLLSLPQFRSSFIKKLTLFIHTQHPFPPLRRRPQQHIHCEDALTDRAHKPKLGAALRDIRLIDTDGVNKEKLSSVYRTGAQQLQEEPKDPAHGGGHAVDLDRHWR
jgi:hypothetical protein